MAEAHTTSVTHGVALRDAKYFHGHGEEAVFVAGWHVGWPFGASIPGVVGFAIDFRKPLVWSAIDRDHNPPVTEEDMAFIIAFLRTRPWYKFTRALSKVSPRTRTVVLLPDGSEVPL